MYQCDFCRTILYTPAENCPNCDSKTGDIEGDYDFLTSYFEEEAPRRRRKFRRKLLEGFVWIGLFSGLIYFAYWGISRYIRIHGAAERGDTGALAQIAAEGYDINYEFGDNFGGTPLIVAAKNGRKAAVEMLLRLGANPNAQDNQTSTALMYAAKNGDLEIIKILRKAGADTSVKDYWGQTALDLARQNGNPEVIRLLEPAR
jgi:hypothetical protein